MALAFDAATETTEWTTTPDPFTFSHTPSGTPKGVLVFISITSSSDLVTSVSYGGVSMSRVDFAVDTVGELLGTYAYFLGSSIPTGAQTVSIDHGGGGSLKWAVAVTLTAAGDTEVAGSAKVQEDTANPSTSSPDTGATTALRFCAITSGLNAGPSALTPNGSMTAVHDIQFTGNSKCARVDRETSTSAGATAIGYTSSSDDVAMIVVAISEASSATTINVPEGTFTMTGFAPTVAAVEVGNVLMAAEIVAYASYLEALHGTTEHLQTGTFGCALLTGIDDAIDHSDATMTDALATNEEASAITGYARVTGLSSSGTISRDTGVVRFKPPNVTFSTLGAVGEQVVGAILFKDGANDGARLPICWITFQGSVALDGTDFVLRWPEAAGAFRSRVVES